MRTFKHYTAKSLEEASQMLTQEGRKARLVAGGTDLLGGLKDAIHGQPPSALIDLKRIPGLDGIEETETGLSLGAGVSLRRLEQDPRVLERYPLLARAARAVASPQLRNMGTLGGNICQEVRCWYYRYPDDFFHCLRKGGKQCPAFIGENRFHSIFGGARVGPTPCRQACPAGTDIPAYLELFRAGRVEEAAGLLLQVNPMPAVTGRVCPHFCQEECNRAELDEPVSIRSVERHLGDYILDHADRFYTPPKKELDASVGILGAGPAGLAAAYFLRRAGLKVTLYDRRSEPGGMLCHAIPAYRLPREIVARLVAALEGMGVGFSLGREVSDPSGLDKLAGLHQAFFVATGAWGQPRIGLEGEDKALSGLEFLERAARSGPVPVGPRVVVIGGGNVALDVGLTARRLGAASVVLACLESREEMPAHDWEVAQAQEEGIVLKPGWGPARIVEREGGLRIELVRCASVFDHKGAFCPAYDRSATETLEADQVFLAVGQRVETAHLDPALLNKRGLAAVNAFSQASAKRGFFSGATWSPARPRSSGPWPRAKGRPRASLIGWAWKGRRSRPGGRPASWSFPRPRSRPARRPWRPGWTRAGEVRTGRMRPPSARARPGPRRTGALTAAAWRSARPTCPRP